MKLKFLLIWEAIKGALYALANVKPLKEIDKRIEELENELEPYKQQEKQARHDAMEAIANNWPDKFDNADGRLREAERNIDTAYAKFGKAVHNALRYKN